MKLLYLILIFTTVTAAAQTAGDEDKDMLNNAKIRDQRAIDDAVNGWWTASMKQHDARMRWWQEARFGMFIHWGIYSLPGGEWKGHPVNGYAEHLMRKEKITRKEYLELAHRFNPVNFNAEAWVKQAKQAGMRYMIITAKHHDGFAMFNSQVSDFNIMKQTPFHRDPMAELRRACKKYGIRFGFYYSHAFDWEHPDAPGNDWEYKNPGGDLNLYGGTNWYDVHPELLSKAQHYVDEKAIPQIKELINKYHPDILWFDTPHKLPLSENIRILKAIRETDPNVVVNGRLARSAAVSFGDYKNTADRPSEFFPVTGDWEAIPTTNESYGYHRFDSSHKPPAFFIRLLANAASRGGNLLMNIGPKGDGTFDSRDQHILQGIGQWMERNGESIYGTQASPLPLQSWGVCTMKDRRIFLHVFQWPSNGKLYVGGLLTPVRKASLLAAPNKSLRVQRTGKMDLYIELPSTAPDTVNTVIAVDLDGPPATDSVRYVSANIPLTRFLTFDATQHGRSFSFGDGKANRYYVDGWKDSTQWLGWTFRSTETIPCKLLIKYLADDNEGGDFECRFDDVTISRKVAHQKGVITEEFTQLQLAPGIHQVSIHANNISGAALMKPLEIQMIVTNEKNR